MTHEHYEDRAQLFSSVNDVKKRASFRVLLPGILPAGMELKVAAYYKGPPMPVASERLDHLELFYEGAGRKLVIRQGNVGTPQASEETPNTAKGTLTIQGKPAVWLDGMNTSSGWKPGLIQVSWSPNGRSATIVGNNIEVGEASDPSLPLTCTVFAPSREYSLDDLIQVAQSVH